MGGPLGVGEPLQQAACRGAEGGKVPHDPFTPPIPPTVLEPWARTGELHILVATRGWPFIRAVLASGLLPWLATQPTPVSDATIQAARCRRGCRRRSGAARRPI